MATDFARQKATSNRRRGAALFVIPSALLLSTGLSLINPDRANAAPRFERHGSHGASRIVKKRQPKTAPQVTSQPQESKRTSPIFVQQGSHGAHRIVNQKGVGGLQRGGAYKGFPKLEQKGSHGGYRLAN